LPRLSLLLRLLMPRPAWPLLRPLLRPPPRLMHRLLKSRSKQASAQQKPALLSRFFYARTARRHYRRPCKRSFI
jgi:hypothetical protein